MDTTTTDSELKLLTDQIIAFRDERDWKQFHNPKDLAISLVLEATEVMEHFQWKTPAEITAYLATNKSDIADELADTLNSVLLLAHELDIDLGAAVTKKMAENAAKYPADKARGKHDKYTAYQA